MVPEPYPPIPLVTSHSRVSAVWRSPQISRPKSTGEEYSKSAGWEGGFTRPSWRFHFVWTRKKWTTRELTLFCRHSAAQPQPKLASAAQQLAEKVGSTGTLACAPLAK